MRWSWKFSGGARKEVSCELRDGRVVHRRSGWRSRETKREKIVHSAMTRERKAQGPERKSCCSLVTFVSRNRNEHTSNCTALASGGFSLYSADSYMTAVTSGLDEEICVFRGLRWGVTMAFSGSMCA